MPPEAQRPNAERRGGTPVPVLTSRQYSIASVMTSGEMVTGLFLGLATNLIYDLLKWGRGYAVDRDTYTTPFRVIWPVVGLIMLGQTCLAWFFPNSGVPGAGGGCADKRRLAGAHASGIAVGPIYAERPGDVGRFLNAFAAHWLKRPGGQGVASTCGFGISSP